MTTIDALVEALEKISTGDAWHKDGVIGFAKEALARARAEQAEPLGHLHVRGALHDYHPTDLAFNLPDGKHAIYTTPPAAPAKLEPPHGYALFPIEPTAEMIEETLPFIDTNDFAYLWKQLLKVAHNAKLGGA